MLIIPHTGKKKLRGESNFLLYEDMAKFFVSRGDVVYFLVPHWAKEEELNKIDNVFYFRKRTDDVFFKDIFEIDYEVLDLFDLRFGKYPIDVVITSKPAIIPSMKCFLSEGRGFQ